MNAVPFFSAFSVQDFLFMVQGAGKTLWLTLWSGLAGTAIGLVVGWIRSIRLPVAAQLLAVYIDVIRTVPLIIQFILVNSGAAIAGMPLSPFATGILVLSLYMGGFVAEVVTAGIHAVPTRLRRAGRSLGLTYWQDLRYVVLPLSLRAVFPAWVGLLLGLMKDSSLIAVVGYIELLRASQIIINRTEQPLQVLLGAGAFYFVMSFALSRSAAGIERRWKH
jgi:His/Glu/Gln/Arg/opine family amino acid ABC transporter permease subunit